MTWYIPAFCLYEEYDELLKFQDDTDDANCITITREKKSKRDVMRKFDVMCKFDVIWKRYVEMNEKCRCQSTMINLCVY